MKFLGYLAISACLLSGILADAPANSGYLPPKPAVDPPAPILPKPAVDPVKPVDYRPIPIHVGGVVQPLWTYGKAEDFVRDYEKTKPADRLSSVKQLFKIRSNAKRLEDGISKILEGLKDCKDEKDIQLRGQLNNILSPPKPRPVPYTSPTKPGETKPAPPSGGEKPGAETKPAPPTGATAYNKIIYK